MIRFPTIIAACLFAAVSASAADTASLETRGPIESAPVPSNLRLWYRQAATNWHEALPVGNGRLGALVFGGVQKELIQLNEDSVWSGHRYYTEKPEVRAELSRVRELLFAGKYGEAQALADKSMSTKPDPRYGAYQPLGDLNLDFVFPSESVTNYDRELGLDSAMVRTSFESGGVK